MAKCEWSVEGICQCFLDKNSGQPPCDGEHALPCRQGNLDLISISSPGSEGPGKKNPGRGGKRPGAGAPRGNLNALKDGVYSLQLKRIHREELRILQTARENRAKRTAGPEPS